MKRSAAISITAFLLLIVVGGLIYSNTLSSPFLFDSVPRILKNPNVRISELSMDNLAQAAFNQSSPKNRPVANITFAVNYFFHQYETPGYHVINIAIHILTAFLLYLLFKTTLALSGLQMASEYVPVVAFISTLIWFTNPLHTQSVSYIVQRANSMAALFYLLSLCLYIRGKRGITAGRRAWPWYTGAVIAWFISMGCKQNAALLPMFILLYEWYFFQNLDAVWIRKRVMVISVAVVLIAGAALLFLGNDPLGRINALHAYGRQHFTYLERIATQPRVLVYYLSLFFFPKPSRLTVDYDYPLSTSIVNPITTLPSLLLIIAALMGALYSARRYRLLSFSIIWYFGNHLVESSFIPLDIIFEHRTYLPTMFVPLVPVIWAFTHIKKKPIVAGLLLLPALMFGYWTYERNKVWQNAIALWQDTVKKSPQKARPHFNLGESYAEIGEEQ
ncbi:MAG: hypothetical protein PVJ53_15365, partial [Desulfobacterales bacterium]